MASDHVTVAEEEYLQSIFWLQEAGLPMTGANVARAMQLSPPTVHEMIGRLERDGYITRSPTKQLEFTEHGLEHAEGIVRRHRLIERFLTDVLGIPWYEVHEEAERLEHAMSPVLEARMLAAIGDAKTCPHGHPIQPARASPASRSATSRSARACRSCASRTRPRTCCYLPRRGHRARQEGHGRELGRRGGDRRLRRRHRDADRLGRRDGRRAGRPVAAAAHRAARAARARPRALRALSALGPIVGPGPAGPLRRDQPVAALRRGRPSLRAAGQPLLADAARRRLHAAPAAPRRGRRAARRYGIGVTNVVARPTRAAAELSDEELRAGAAELEATVARLAPRLVAVLGLAAYRTAFGRRSAAWGLQPEPLAGRPVWVLPNPSGLNAHYKPADFARVYGEARAYADTLWERVPAVPARRMPATSELDARGGIVLPMTSSDARSRLHRLQAERLDAVDAGLDRNDALHGLPRARHRGLPRRLHRPRGHRDRDAARAAQRSPAGAR